MADKFLSFETSGQVLKEGLVTSAGAGDAGKIPALDADGKLDDSVMPVGVGADIEVIVASEALTAGDFVNIYDDTGTRKVRKADASDNTKPAHGFVKANVLNGGNASVYLNGKNGSLAALTVGATYFLSDTPGAVTATPDTTTAGASIQQLGVAVAADTISFEFQEPITVE